MPEFPLPADPAAPLAVHLAAIALILMLPLMTAAWLAERRRLHAPPLSPSSFLLLCGGLIALCAAFTLWQGAAGFFWYPDWSLAEAGGIMLSLLSPAAAACFLVANLFLRPWELLPLNPFFTTLPRLLAALCVLSWLMHGLMRRRLRLALNLPIALFALYCVWLLAAAAGAGSYEASRDYLSANFMPALAPFLLLVLTA